MSPYFTDRPVTTVLFIATVGAWVVLEGWQSRRTRPTAEHRDRGSYYVLTGCIAVGWVVAAFSTAIPGAALSGQPLVFAGGLVLAWAGIALRVWAFRTLGRYFTFRVQTSSDQQVITSGPYRYVRHPGYSALILVMIGLGLLYGDWPGLLALVALPTAGLVWRIRLEERALESDPGAAYSTYAASRQRLVPGVW